MLLTGVLTTCPSSCDMGGVVVTALRGDRLGAGTMTVPVDPVDGLISSARGGGSHCREKLSRETRTCLRGDCIIVGEAEVMTAPTSLARGVLLLRLAASAAGRLLSVRVVELLKSA
jgi:hypothetical protein